jgi:hypothetical protein
MARKQLDATWLQIRWNVALIFPNFFQVAPVVSHLTKVILETAARDNLEDLAPEFESLAERRVEPAQSRNVEGADAPGRERPGATLHALLPFSLSQAQSGSGGSGSAAAPAAPQRACFRG